MTELLAKSLAADIRDGDKDAFELFYRMEYANLLHFVQNYLNDQAQSEDVVQNTFMQLWMRRESIDADRNMRAFVFTIARNNAISLLRTRARVAGRYEDKVNLEAFCHESITDQINALALKDLIEETYQKLPKHIQQSFQMSRQEGLTNREIAQNKGLSEKAIEYHMKVALRLFRDKLKDYLPPTLG